MSVRKGSLVQEEALDAREAALLTAVSAPARTKAQHKACRPFWSDWVRKPCKHSASKRNGRPPLSILCGADGPQTRNLHDMARVLPECVRLSRRKVQGLYSAAGLERFLPRMGSGPIPPYFGGLDYM